jgi:hypothetical protein
VRVNPSSTLRFGEQPAQALREELSRTGTTRGQVACQALKLRWPRIRRKALGLGLAVVSVLLLPTDQPAWAATTPHQNTQTVERWGLFEASLPGPSDGNPYLEIAFSARFRHAGTTVEAAGFYDGDGVYRVRFMPDEEGAWEYETRSNRPELNGRTGSFTCSKAGSGNHGPVRVRGTFGFGYADGQAFFPFGTTCYVWNHQPDSLEEQTLASLKLSPFNKIRMCVFPKFYELVTNEPPRHPFLKLSSGQWDFERFNPDFFRHLEQRVRDLQALGVEADLILFHPYDRWGYAKMDAASDERYLRHVVARLAAFRNIWWSLANEYDLMLRTKPMERWDEFFRIVQAADPSGHLRSIHNCERLYDHTKPWVTHVCIQAWDVKKMKEWRDQYRKPVIDDELEYEGNIRLPWGSLSGPEMVHRFWMCCVAGGYAGHGETYMDPQQILWWSKGGVLKGESPKRLAFLRQVIESAPVEGLEPISGDWVWGRGGLVGGRVGEFRLIYFGDYQPSYWNIDVPKKSRFKAEVIDTWNMTITPMEGVFEPGSKVPLPGKPGRALRLTPVP